MAESQAGQGIQAQGLTRENTTKHTETRFFRDFL